MEILKAYKFRVYPNKDQVKNLDKTFGCVRFIWNSLTANFNSYGKDSYIENLSEKLLKEQYPFLKEVSAASLQQKRIDFEETKNQFFNKHRKTKLGRMKFKKKKVSRDSYRLPSQKFKLDQEQSLIQIEKIGNIKIVLDRIISDEANLRSVTISKDKSGKFFVSILVKTNQELLPPTGNKVGIDLGLKDLFILSSGETISNPKWFRETQSKLKKAQKALSRKKKDSKNYEKQRIKVAKIHEKIRNQRDFFLHNTSIDIIRKNDVICIEDLNVYGMIKNHKLSKSIQDASWSKFVMMLNYKSSFYGRTLIKIDRFYPSSKTCSNCGYKLESLDLKTRNWSCPSCGQDHDRDVNASLNILYKGYSDLTGLSLEEAKKELFTKSGEPPDYRCGEDVRL